MLDQIDKLQAEIAVCKLCRSKADGVRGMLQHEPRPVVVLSNTARILIAGQAPGTRVHGSGIPFDDASGDRLREWLGVGRDQFYNSLNFAVLPMGFCFPGQDSHGGDLPPRRECAPFWRQRALDLMPQIELVLAIGQYAQRWHLPSSNGSMTETVRNWKTHIQHNVLPLPHPSWRNSGWIRKNAWFAQELLPELRKRVSRWIV